MVVSWTDVLPFHPAIAEAAAPSSGDKAGWINGYLPALSQQSRAAIGTTKTRLKGDIPALHADDPHATIRAHNLMVMRGADLLIWLPSEEGDGGLRALNLLDVQRRCAAESISKDQLEAWASHLESKPLSTPQITFAPRRLLLHPSGDYLAVIGDRSVAVVVLPKALAMRTTHAVECKSIAVGPYIHPPDLSNTIAEVKWHPLSEGGKDLTVLSSDGVLRLYHLSRCSQPDQTCAVTPESDPLQRLSAKKTSSTKDYEMRAPSDEAVSFAFGTGSNGPWGPLTTYVLFRNGDIYTVCPFMPQKRYS